MVSIIIAAYNGAQFIKRTINSALCQDVDKEIIVIDDCSTDDTYNIVEKCANNSTIIKIAKNDTNIGFCRTVNKALEMATGEYVLVLGQDDLLDMNHCRKMLESFTDTSCLVFCDYDLIDEDDNVYDTTKHCKHEDRDIKDLYKFNSIPSVGLIMIRSKLIEVGGYPENKRYPHYGEYHTWVRMALTGDLVFCESTRAKYRRHKNNMTNNFSNRRAKIELNAYYNTCRRQFLGSNQISIKSKIYVCFYMMYSVIKVLCDVNS